MKEQNDRNTKAAGAEVPRLRNEVTAKNGQILPIIFHCVSVSCGVWTYDSRGSNILYAPQKIWDTGGSARFGDRAMILRMNSNHRIEFRYGSTIDITLETGSSPSIIFSMYEPARFFEEVVDDPLENLMAQLNIQQKDPRVRNTGPSRYRMPYLDKEHKPIAGNCLVYKIVLAADHTEDTGRSMHLLRQAHGVPELVYRQIRMVSFPESYADTFNKLQMAIEASTFGCKCFCDLCIPKYVLF